MRKPDKKKTCSSGIYKSPGRPSLSGDESSGEKRGVDGSDSDPAASGPSGSEGGDGAQLTQYFFSLTPDRIMEAFYQAGINCQPAVRFLNSLENRVACVEDEDGRRWVAKFYRPCRHSIEALDEEHCFLKELRDEGMPVIPPLELKNGRGTTGSIAGIYFAVFPHCPGRPPDEIDPAKATLLGEMLAKLHNVGERRAFLRRDVWSPGSLGESDLEVLSRAMPPEIWSRYERSARKLLGFLALRLGRTARLRIHGDFHRGNLLWGAAGPVIVDFDDTTMGPPVQDFWMMLSGRDAEAVSLREAMIESYERFRPFDLGSLELIEALRAFRYVHYAAWLTARRDDPAFVRVLDDFGSRSYWRNELEELDSQLESFL
jgi:Ser/Thr protein kinase RdoA (MazF antagonist)